MPPVKHSKMPLSSKRALVNYIVLMNRGGPDKQVFIYNFMEDSGEANAMNCKRN